MGAKKAQQRLQHGMVDRAGAKHWRRLAGLSENAIESIIYIDIILMIHNERLNPMITYDNMSHHSPMPMSSCILGALAVEAAAGTHRFPASSDGAATA